MPRRRMRRMRRVRPGGGTPRWMRRRHVGRWRPGGIESKAANSMGKSKGIRCKTPKKNKTLIINYGLICLHQFKDPMNYRDCKCINHPKTNLVGGFNPVEKYARQNRFIFPNFRGENKEYLSCHHLVNLN